MLCDWLDQVRNKRPQLRSYEYFDSAIFAVLCGLNPTQCSTTESRTEYFSAGNQWGGIHESYETVVDLPEGRAPYDFSDHRINFWKFKELYENITTFWPTNSSYCLDPGISDNIDHLTDQVRNNKEILEVWTEMVSSIVRDNRCLYVLSSGFAGSGPIDMEIDDEVFLVEGVPTPMVFRSTPHKKHPEELKVVGPCLVHRLMHCGEFVTADKRDIILT
jgi:hypothetical protein